MRRPEIARNLRSTQLCRRRGTGSYRSAGKKMKNIFQELTKERSAAQPAGRGNVFGSASLRYTRKDTMNGVHRALKTPLCAALEKYWRPHVTACEHSCRRELWSTDCMYPCHSATVHSPHHMGWKVRFSFSKLYLSPDSEIGWRFLSSAIATSRPGFVY